MRKVITYGTFDLLHYGHISLLRRARGLGDYLIVGLSTDEFSEKAKGKKVFLSWDERRQLLEAVRFVDAVIPERSWDQKVNDIVGYGVTTFVIGDDWKGRFDYLRDYCRVLYLPRTPDISTSAIKFGMKGFQATKPLSNAIGTGADCPMPSKRS